MSHFCPLKGLSTMATPVSMTQLECRSRCLNTTLEKGPGLLWKLLPLRPGRRSPNLCCGTSHHARKQGSPRGRRGTSNDSRASWPKTWHSEHHDGAAGPAKIRRGRHLTGSFQLSRDGIRTSNPKEITDLSHDCELLYTSQREEGAELSDLLMERHSKHISAVNILDKTDQRHKQ